ncbi:MAG: Crp/Fnr family transcriptional regulator [Bacteroidota bacterium]
MHFMYHYFSRFGEISTSGMELLLSLLHQGELTKGETLIRANQKVDSIYCVEEGFLHYYTYSEFGDRITLNVISPDTCWTVLESFYNQEPALGACTALTPVKYYKLERPDYLRIKAENPELNTLIQTITEQILSAKVIEANNRSKMTIEERYLHLLQNKPAMIQHVPVAVIASLLGTSRETLHRIRRKLAAA